MRVRILRTNFNLPAWSMLATATDFSHAGLFRVLAILATVLVVATDHTIASWVSTLPFFLCHCLIPFLSCESVTMLRPD